MLLVATNTLPAQLVARLLNLAVVADEEFVDQHRVAVLLRRTRESLPVGRPHVTGVDRELYLVLPLHARRLADHLWVQLAPGRGAQLVALARHIE